MINKTALLTLLVIFGVLNPILSQSPSDNSGYWERFKSGSTEIADFSYAGYDFGESELPKKHKLKEFKVEDFGAIADDDKSDKKAIIKAITSAEKAGGGVVLFGSGTYLINEEKGLLNGIIIRSDNIVLKGKGDQEGGTILKMTEHLEPTDPTKLWTTPAMFEFKGTGEGSDLGKFASSVKMGDMNVEFEKPHGLKSGDVVGFFAEGTFLSERLLKGKKTRDIWANINQKGPYVDELHQVASISGNKVTFRAPILIDMNVGESWRIEKMDMISNCGFEDIRFVGNFHEPYVHHKNAFHDGGYTAVHMSRSINSWVRNCSFVDVNEAVSIKGSLCGTMYKNQVLGNGGHSSFGLSRSTRGLIAYCGDQANQWHGPNASHGSVGSVILRFEGKNRGIDLHAAFPRITLFDDCIMAGFDGDSVGRASHGGSHINLPNHLDGLVFWNFKQIALPRPDFDFWDLMETIPDAKYGPLTAVDPILVGFQGEGTSFVEKNVGGIESFNQAVMPKSLYLAQLERRFGKVPNYLKESK